MLNCVRLIIVLKIVVFELNSQLSPNKKNISPLLGQVTYHCSSFWEMYIYYLELYPSRCILKTFCWVPTSTPKKKNSIWKLMRIAFKLRVIQRSNVHKGIFKFCMSCLYPNENNWDLYHQVSVNYWDLVHIWWKRGTKEQWQVT